MIESLKIHLYTTRFLSDFVQINATETTEFQNFLVVILSDIVEGTLHFRLTKPINNFSTLNTKREITL